MPKGRLEEDARIIIAVHSLVFMACPTLSVCMIYVWENKKIFKEIMHFSRFLKHFLLYYVAWFRQTKYIAIITKIANFLNPGIVRLYRGVAIVHGHGHISHIVKMHSLKIFSSTPKHR